MKLFVSFLIIIFTGICVYAVQVDGYCYLAGQTNHEGTKVLFQADSPSAITDSVFTDSTGYYQIDVSLGIYDVYFSHEGYEEDEIPDQACFSTLTLPTITLYIHLSGSLSGVLEGVPYIIDSGISVESGDSLIIEPGTVLFFSGGYNLTVRGYLQAIGTEEDSIIFMPNTGVQIGGGLDFSSSASDSCVVKFISITHGQMGISCYESSPTIHNSTLANNSSFGISFNHSNGTIINSVITNNSNYNNGGGVKCQSSNPIIDNCIIANNSSTGSGGGVYCNYSNPNIIDCEIYENQANSRGGGINIDGDSNPFISQCIISDNTSTNDGGGISFMGNGNLAISNCTISGNTTSTEGGGICKVEGGELNIINTIIEGNFGNGGIYFESLNTGSITYNNLNNNEGGNFAGNYLPDWLGQIVTVNANGDSCDVYMNIFEDPLFVDPTNNNLSLLWNSPCIDAGDQNSPIDPDGTIADIGAYYFDQSPPPSPIEDLTITIDGADVILEWSSIPNATIYYIYRSTEPYFETVGMTPIFEIEDNQYYDVDAILNNVYFYRVTSE